MIIYYLQIWELHISSNLCLVNSLLAKLNPTIASLGKFGFKIYEILSIKASEFCLFQRFLRGGFALLAPLGLYVEGQLVLPLPSIHDHLAGSGELAFQYLLRQRILHELLNGPLQRPGSKGGIEPFLCQKPFCPGGQLKGDPPLL